MLTIDQIKQLAIPVLQKHGVKRAGLFGSYATGYQDDSSDIDLLVLMSPNDSLFDLIHIKYELEDIFEKKVDLVDYRGIKKMLVKRILSEEIRFYG